MVLIYYIIKINEEETKDNFFFVSKEEEVKDCSEKLGVEVVFIAANQEFVKLVRISTRISCLLMELMLRYYIHMAITRGLGSSVF